MKLNSFSEKIIKTRNNSFKVWVEFEESDPWENIDCEFCNILVNTLDGRKYGINIWTYKYLTVAIEQEKKDNNNDFLIPPDLFVKELTRDKIEIAISELLNNGNIEDQLNRSIFDLDFLDPYWDADEMNENSQTSLLNELELELSEEHILFNQQVELLARNSRNDEIILELEGNKIAVVNLTWSATTESDNFPITRIFNDKIDFWKKEMKQEIQYF